MKTEQIALEVADQICTAYDNNARYVFTDQNMIDFAEKFLASWLEQQSQEPVAYMAPSGTCVTAEDVSYTPNWTDYYTTPLVSQSAAAAVIAKLEEVAFQAQNAAIELREQLAAKDAEISELQQNVQTTADALGHAHLELAAMKGEEA